MKRKTSFRAWDKDKKRLVDTEYMAVGFNGNILEICPFETDGFGAPPIVEKVKDRYVLMQSTGLYDKNGKEIFEGDILKTNSGNFYVKEALPFITLVSCSQGYEYDNGDYYQGGNIKMHDWDRFEIIGNIYENPELVKD